MTTFKTLAILAVLSLSGVSAFAPAPTASSSRLAPLNAYVPDGLSPQEWNRIKQQEQQKFKNKDLGRLGPRGFKSRSMEAWQKAYERGETGHHFAPIGFREKLKQGLLKKEDVPYMLRPGGKWDNSDVFGAKTKRWLKEDKEYAKGGYKKEQSASILGSGPGFDWTGSRPRSENLKKLVPGLS